MTSVTEDTVGLSWEEPEDDGGCEIMSYTLERRDPGKRTWEQVTKADEYEATVTSLKEGSAYMFRVAAENEVGMGPFTELPKPVTPKSQFGTSNDYLIFVLTLIALLLLLVLVSRTIQVKFEK